MNNYYAIIMAGGGGTRLWPLSRKNRPKQMLQLGSDRTLFQSAINRLEGLFPSERILVVTVAEQARLLQNQTPQIPTENFLLEPMPRGTASVVGLAAVAILEKDPDGVMAILTADHVIANEKAFHTLLLAGFQVANQGQLVTLGITPTYPATGYGYIQRGECQGENLGLPHFKVERFIEKPDEKRAIQLIAMGNHDWNSGMFIWRADRIYEEIKQLMPDLYSVLVRIRSDWGRETYRETLVKHWQDIQPQTIDYGIMEKASQVSVLPAVDLGWNDVGSWESLFEVLPADENGNIILGTYHIGPGTKESLLFSDSTHRLIATIGLSNMVVVDTPDALLICSRNDTQRVRELVNTLRQMQKNEYL